MIITSKTIERYAFVAMLAGAALSMASMAVFPASKAVTSAGIFLDIAGVIQLQISGLFGDIVRDYYEKLKNPPGVLNQLDWRTIRQKDSAARSLLRRHLFVRPQTGYILILCGFVLQLAGVWAEP